MLETVLFLIRLHNCPEFFTSFGFDQVAFPATPKTTAKCFWRTGRAAAQEEQMQSFLRLAELEIFLSINNKQESNLVQLKLSLN